MIYDEVVHRGIRKKYLPEPNPAKIEISTSAGYNDLLEVAKLKYFSEFQPELDKLSLADSTGMPITVASPETWTVGSFYASNSLQPSRYKLYVVLKVSFFLSLCAWNRKRIFFLDRKAI